MTRGVNVVNSPLTCCVMRAPDAAITLVATPHRYVVANLQRLDGLNVAVRLPFDIVTPPETRAPAPSVTMIPAGGAAIDRF